MGLTRPLSRSGQTSRAGRRQCFLSPRCCARNVEPVIVKRRRSTWLRSIVARRRRAHEANLHEAAVVRERGDVPGEIIAADDVEDDVHAAAAGVFLDDRRRSPRCGS